MKQNLPLLWWLVSSIAIALVFGALGYALDQAVLLTVFFLPGMLALRYFVPQLSLGKRPGELLNAVYLVAAVVAIEYLALIFGHRVAFDTLPDTLPGAVFHPLFILLLIAVFIVPERLIARYLEQRQPYDDTLSFISERRRITLDPGEIRYIESNDDEVWIHTAAGEAYRTKTRISQWEAQLDRRFLRVHRSWIVNTEHIDEYRPNRIRIGTTEIEISRKYKEEVRIRLGKE
ncbi:MAG TPA: LytTR family transcriptional regulator [Candidatus Alistipes cottocaccae]|nr:LytTR family transcriptional regulator [Candidatus Alistipes cottocaccae]